MNDDDARALLGVPGRVGLHATLGILAQPGRSGRAGIATVLAGEPAASQRRPRQDADALADTDVAQLELDAALEQAQVERVRALRARRDAQAVDTALNKLEQAAGVSENLLPRILECVESYATVGEISNRLRRVWGEYRETSTI